MQKSPAQLQREIEEHQRALAALQAQLPLPIKPAVGRTAMRSIQSDIRIDALDWRLRRQSNLLLSLQ